MALELTARDLAFYDIVATELSYGVVAWAAPRPTFLSDETGSGRTLWYEGPAGRFGLCLRARPTRARAAVAELRLVHGQTRGWRPPWSRRPPSLSPLEVVYAGRPEHRLRILTALLAELRGLAAGVAACRCAVCDPAGARPSPAAARRTSRASRPVQPRPPAIERAWTYIDPEGVIRTVRTVTPRPPRRSLVPLSTSQPMRA